MIHGIRFEYKILLSELSENDSLFFEVGQTQDGTYADKIRVIKSVEIKDGYLIIKGLKAGNFPL